jgi:D-3-phosphoglycerate dehydrogenase / 2-oxoglutarate reductase
MLGRLNDVFARSGINIAAQFYQTDGEVGYVVVETDTTDVDPEALLEELRSIDGTIRARLLYERR